MLGQFEEVVLAAILRLGTKPYGVTIRKEIEERTGKSVSIGALYTTLDRLEAKGYVSSWLGDPTPERGGRAKRYFQIQAVGEKALNESDRIRRRMREGLEPRTGTVGEDWLSWLPVEKDEVFDAAVAELEPCYALLSVTLNEAFALRSSRALIHAREQVGVCADLFDRLAARLAKVLRAMEDHGRHFGTVPNVPGLNPDFFRGETAQRSARKNNIVAKLLFSVRSSFFHKLRALGDTVEDLQGEFREAAEDIADGASLQPGTRWQALDTLQLDLNTCLREAVVILKSFLCDLPSEEVQLFRQKYKAPARSSLTSFDLRPARPTGAASHRTRRL